MSTACQRQLKDKDWLYEQYWGELNSLYDIADETGCKRHKVEKAFHDHGIPRRPPTWDEPLGLNPLRGFAIERETAYGTKADVPSPRDSIL